MIIVRAPFIKLQDANMNYYKPNEFEPHNWMAATPAIDNLSLCELTLPGTHNAGCDLEASYTYIVTGNWTACQDVPIYSQLNRGARALDIRLVFDDTATGLKKFRLCHDKIWSSRTLEDVIKDIKSFLERSYNEFIILDIHALHDHNERFDLKYFNDMMLKHLEEHLIPAVNRHLSLGQLKEASRTQRVLVAAPDNYELDSQWFCRKIQHKWAGTEVAADTALPYYRLDNYITKVMKNPPGTSAPWSLSAAVYTAGGPLRMLEQLDEWFDPAKSNWAEKCSIINFDFIKNSKIVSHCRTANLNKASRKIK